MVFQCGFNLIHISLVTNDAVHLPMHLLPILILSFVLNTFYGLVFLLNFESSLFNSSSSKCVWQIFYTLDEGLLLCFVLLVLSFQKAKKK